MPTKAKVVPRDYYDVTPALGHAAGDIWSGLPAYELLGGVTFTGIVITPACDLANRKVETISYLPVIPIKRYFATPAFLPDLLRRVRGQLIAAGIDHQLESPAPFVWPSLAEVDDLIAKTKARLSNADVKTLAAAERAEAGLSLLRAASQDSCCVPPPGVMACLLGDKEWASTLSSIVRNSFSPDIHFLPSDQQPVDWSGIPEPSVALFRYPLAAPIQVLDAAQDVAQADWPAVIGSLARAIPSARHLLKQRPLKHATLIPRYFADLLTRYIGMHVRLGSPDFSGDTVAAFVSELQKRLQ